MSVGTCGGTGPCESGVAHEPVIWSTSAVWVHIVLLSHVSKELLIKDVYVIVLDWMGLLGSTHVWSHERPCYLILAKEVSYTASVGRLRAEGRGG